jgi:hypothetical protein
LGCTEKFYEEQVKKALQVEKVSELAEERKRMLEILKKLQNLADVSSADEASLEEALEESLEERLGSLSLDGLNRLTSTELEMLLGNEHLAQFKQLIESGVTAEWLEEGGISRNSQSHAEWFRRFDPEASIQQLDKETYSIPTVPLGLPSFQSLTKAQPSDFLWNNLLEIAIVYGYICTLFDSEELRDAHVLATEVRPIVAEFATSLQKPQPNEPSVYFQSAADALETGMAALKMNTVDWDRFRAFDDLFSLLRHPKLVELMLADLYGWYCRGAEEQMRPLSGDDFYLSKKLLFYLVWYRAELAKSPEAVASILQMLTNIAKGCSTEDVDEDE